jgi:hypothetical protein
LTFGVSISRSALKDALNWGFQALVPNLNAQQPTINYLAAWLPLAGYDGTTGTDQIGFTCQVNPLNPNNLITATPTKFFFTGVTSGSQTTTSLDSYYRTNAGKHITLIPNADPSNGQQPAALVVTNGYQSTHTQNGFSLAPDGDFILTVDGATANETVTMICGLSGTETVTFLPYVFGGYAGYRVRFKSLQAANAPVFPLVTYSPVSAPIDPKAMLLDCTFVTSWASVLPPPNDTNTAFYAAAPKGADLFGQNGASSQAASGPVLQPTSPGVALSPSIVMPLYPFAGFVSGTGDRDLNTQQLDDLERQILSATRRAAIARGPQNFAAHAHHSLGIRAGLSTTAAPACPFNATTPAGFISRVACDGSWDQLLLAQVSAPGSSAISLQIGFTKLHNQLQAAFQTNNMFLVVANAKYLGAPASGTFMAPGAPAPGNQNQFYNTFSIGDWGFHAAVGEENQYGDYRNVMIVKGMKGKLVDLVVSPDKWTMKETFASPTTKASGPDPDVSQLVPLSAWISSYFDAALQRLTNEKDSPYFQNFCQLIQRDDWTGVLILRVDIANVPKDLAGITAGVNDPADFYAHHIGIEISQIDGTTVQQKDASSLFGLVYYVDPAYDDSQAAHPIAPKDVSQPYDFTLLTLKALFANSALQKFDSLAEVVLNDIFGATVESMVNGNIYNAVLLQGAFQKHGDTAVYSLSSNGTNTYLLANNVLTAVEIDSAVMSTRDDGSTSGNVVSWIAMSGFMNFALIKDISGASNPLPDFDIFSFGTADGAQTARTGLNFTNVGLQITFKKQSYSTFTHAPSLRGAWRRNGLLATNGTDPSAPQLLMVESEISFNTSNSTPRPLGLFKNFQLELLGLQSGYGDTTPQSLGYLAVGTQYGLQGVAGNAWHGLRFNLNLGTPGELAGKINLTSTLLVSWSDTSGETNSGKAYQAAVGIALPGTSSGGSIFSLQSVLKLSIGVVQLFYNGNADTQSFVLLLNQIALKFFGLLKIPPNGATAFFLFGNRKAESPTGLGWYAIYNQEVTPPKTLAAAHGNGGAHAMAALGDEKGEA